MEDASLKETRAHRLSDIPELVEAVSTVYDGIALVQAHNGRSVVFRSHAAPEFEGMEVPWDVFVRDHASRRIFTEDITKLVDELCVDSLQKLILSGMKGKTFDVRFLGADDAPIWMEMMASVVSKTEEKILVTARSVNDQRFLRSIVDLFVYNNCDYFIRLDVKRNSYRMFGGNGVLPMLPRASEDYEAIMGQYIDDHVVPEDREKTRRESRIQRIVSKLGREGSHSFSYGLLTPGGEYRRKRLQYIDYDKHNGVVLMVRSDLTKSFLETRAQNELLKEALRKAQTDQLTGIYNHSTCVFRIKETLDDGHCGALLFIDMDDFKQINDTQGHMRGDCLLQYVAKEVSRTLRPADVVGRIGGDEFLVLLTDVSDPGEIAEHAKRLCKIVEDYPMESSPVSCSIGIARYPQDDKDFRMLLDKADKAMYTAKSHGKNGFAFWALE